MLKSLLGGYGKVNVARSSFVLDPTGAASGEDGSFDWSKVANYNMVYTGTNTVTSYQNIDNIIATYGGGSVTSEVVITQVTPASGPAGSKFTALGLNFGPSQGQSSLYFQNEQAGTWILADIITWGNQQINAIVPEKAAKGGYKLQVIKVAIVAGGISALESNKADFTITAPSPANGVVIAYPNPFNPISAITTEATTTFAFNPNGAVNMYVGLYDMTARLVKKIDATASGVTWDGRDENGKLVGDGAYLIRVVDKDSNRLIAKGKVLVIKH
jgi:hypothetical protein